MPLSHILFFLVLNSGDDNPLAEASDCLVWLIHAGRVLLRPLPRPLPSTGGVRDVDNDKVDDDELDMSCSNDFSSFSSSLSMAAHLMVMKENK